MSLDDLKARPKKTVEAVIGAAAVRSSRTWRRAVSPTFAGGASILPRCSPSSTLIRGRGSVVVLARLRRLRRNFFEWFVKDLPLERLAAGDVLLAYELNGAPLPAEYGFPVRLVVPGFYERTASSGFGGLPRRPPGRRAVHDGLLQRQPGCR